MGEEHTQFHVNDSVPLIACVWNIQISTMSCYKISNEAENILYEEYMMEDKTANSIPYIFKYKLMIYSKDCYWNSHWLTFV